MILPIKKISVAEQAIERIYELIKEKELKVGDKLPPERDLIKELKISRTSLREGLRALEIIGVINVRQGHGTIIGDAHISNSIVKPLTFSILLNKNTFIELFEARKVIEVECAGLAAEKITLSELDIIKRTYKSLLRYKNDREKSIKYEIKIHELITSAAKNKVLEKILSSIKSLLRESRDTTVPQEGVSPETLAYHKELIKSFNLHDSSKARSIMYKHLDSVSKRLQKF